MLKTLSSFKYPLDSCAILSRHRGARDRLVGLLIEIERGANLGRHVSVAGALRASIDGARLDCYFEALGAELRRRGRAEQAVRIGADSMSLSAVAAVLGALLDAAIDRGVLIGGIVLAAAELGDYREAVHCAYWATIVHLEGLGLLKRDHARTPRESLRLLEPHPKERQLLGDFTHNFELIWYGYRPASPEDWTNARTHLEKMGCLTRSTPATANS